MVNTTLLVQRLTLLWFGFTVCGQIWSWFFVIYCLFDIHKAALVAVYLAYIWLYGAKAAETESWPTPLRSWSIWRNMANYFSAKLVKTSELDPKGNYIFSVHPHGIAACTTWINFGTDATGFSEHFPGIRRFCLTLASNFNAPFIREYCLLHGLRSASKTSCKNLLTSHPGSAIVIVVGGAAESLLAAPGTNDLVLAKRKGFVRIAVETGASLVPVFAFGENDVFETYIPPSGTRLHKFQQAWKNTFGCANPFFWGVGLFGGTGLLCRKVPLTAVVGAPIQVEKFAGSCKDPAFAEQVDKYHAQYVEALKQLYEEHKQKYAHDRKRELCLADA